jgi:hypothetical protein
VLVGLVSHKGMLCSLNRTISSIQARAVIPTQPQSGRVIHHVGVIAFGLGTILDFIIRVHIPIVIHKRVFTTTSQRIACSLIRWVMMHGSSVQRLWQVYILSMVSESR